jgi:hypothetical protein
MTADDEEDCRKQRSRVQSLESGEASAYVTLDGPNIIRQPAGTPAPTIHSNHVGEEFSSQTVACLVSAEAPCATSDVLFVQKARPRAFV